MPVGGASSIRAGRAYVELFADQSLLTRGLKAAEGKLRRFGQRMTAAGRSLMIGGSATATPFALATVTAMNFSDAILSVKAVSGATGAEFDALSEKAKALGRTTSFTAAQVASGMLSLARAGFSSSEIDAAIAGMLDLARATGTDLAVASDIAATTLRTFGLEAGELTHVADVLVATANSSAQTIEDLGESLKYASPIAQDLGMSLEDTTRILGILANFGIRGSMAGTSMRRLGTAFASPKVQKSLMEMGVAVLDFEKNIRNPADILTDLGVAMQDLSSSERLAIAKDLFDLRAMGSALKLSGDLGAASERLTDAIRNAGGTAARTAAIMDSGLGGAWRMLLSAAEGLGIAIGEALTPIIMKFGDAAIRVVRQMGTFVAQHEGFVIAAAAIGPAMIAAGAALVVGGNALGAMASMATIAVTALGMISSAIGLLLTPVGLLTAAFVALGAAVAAMPGPDGRPSLFMAWAQSIGETVTSLRNTFGDAIAGIADSLRAGDIDLALQIFSKTIEAALAAIHTKAVEWGLSLVAALQYPMTALADLEQWMGLDPTLPTTDENLREKAKKLWAAQKAQYKAERELRELREKASQAAEEATPPWEMPAAPAMPIPTKPTGSGHLDPTVVSAAVKKGGGWLGARLADVAGAVVGAGEAAGAAVGGNMADVLAGGAVEEKLMMESPIDVAAREMQDALTGAAAMRIGGIGNISPAERAAKTADKSLEVQQETKGLMERFVSLVKRGQLTFAGMQPG